MGAAIFGKRSAACCLVILYFMSIFGSTITHPHIQQLADEKDSVFPTQVGQETTIAIGSWPDGANQRVQFDVQNGSSIQHLDFSLEPSTIPDSTATVWNSSQRWKYDAVYDGINVNSSELTLLPKGVIWDFESPNHGWTLGTAWSVGYDTTIGSVNGVHSGSNALYTYDGNYPNGMSQNYATSPTFDCSGCSGSWSLKYWKRLGIESSSYDHAYVQVTNSGGSWSTIWSHTGSTTNPSSWSQMTHDVTNYISGNSNFQVRFIMGTTDGSVTYTGWNIDDIEIEPTGGISNGEGNWTSAVISPLLDGRGELKHYGLMHFDATVSSASTFEWSIIDASTGMVIPGFDQLTELTFDLGIIDYETYPQIRLHIHLVSSGGSSPSIRSISFNGLISYTFDSDPTTAGWSLNGAMWSTSGVLTGFGETYSPDYFVRSGFSKIRTSNDISGDGELQYSLDMGQSWTSVLHFDTINLQQPSFYIQFRMNATQNAQSSWMLNTFNVELVRTSIVKGLRIDVGMDGAPEWSMDQPHFGRLGLQDVMRDGSMWDSVPFTTSSSSNFYLTLPIHGVDMFSFYVASPSQLISSPYLAISIDGADVMSRSLPNIQPLMMINLTLSELDDVNNALMSATNSHGIDGIDMTNVEIRIGSSLGSGEVMFGGVFAPYNASLNISLDSGSAVVLGLNSQLLYSTVTNELRSVSMPIRMDQTGAIRITILDIQTSPSVIPLSLEIENATTTLTPSTSWLQTTSTFDFALLTMEDPLSYAINSFWQVELNINGLSQSSRIRCSIGSLPVTAMSISSCTSSGLSLMWSDAGNMGEIIASSDGSHLEIQHRFKIPDGWNDEDAATLSVHLISTTGPMLPVTYQFGLGLSKGIENDLEVKNWGILSSDGVRSTHEHPFLKAGDEVRIEVQLGFEGVEEQSYPRTGQALVRAYADGIEISSTSIFYQGVALLPYTAPVGRTEVVLSVDVIALKGQQIHFPMANNLTFGFDNVQPTLLYSNIDMFTQKERGQEVPLEFIIADRPHLPTHAYLHLWTSWNDDENGDSRMQSTEVMMYDLTLPDQLSSVSGTYSFDVNIRQASNGDFFIGWLDVADSAGHRLTEGGTFQSPMFYVQINDDDAPSIGTSVPQWEHASDDVWLHPGEVYNLSIPLYERGGIADIHQIDLDLSSNAVQSSTILYNSETQQCESMNVYLEILDCSLNTDNSVDYFARDGSFDVSFYLEWGYDPDVNLIRQPLITLYDQIGQSNQFELSHINWRYSGEMNINTEHLQFTFDQMTSSEIGYFVEPRTIFQIHGELLWYRTQSQVTEDFSIEFSLGENEMIIETENSTFSGELLAPLDSGTFGVFAELADAPSGALFRGTENALVYIIVDDTAPKIIAVNEPTSNRVLMESEWEQQKFEIRIHEEEKMNADSVYLNWAIHEQGLGLNTPSMLEGTQAMTLIGEIDSGTSIPFETTLNLSEEMTVGLRSMALELRIWITGFDASGHVLERSFNDIDAPLRVWSLEQRVAEFEFVKVELSPSTNIREGDSVAIAALLTNIGQATGEAQLVMELVESNGARTRLGSQAITSQAGETILFSQEWVPTREGTMWIEIHLLNSNNTFATSDTLRIESAQSDGLLAGINEVNSTLLVVISLLVASLVVILVIGLRKPQKTIQIIKTEESIIKSLPQLEAQQPEPQQPGYGQIQQSYSPGDNPYQ